jgi:hypothetical protein
VRQEHHGHAIAEVKTAAERVIKGHRAPLLLAQVNLVVCLDSLAVWLPSA